jgi:hypothetical protein
VSYLHVSARPIARCAGVAPFPADLAGLGQPAPTRVSQGQYGLALSRSSIPAAAIDLLVLSPTFRRMAGILDDAYFDHRHWLALQKVNPSLRLNSNFRVVGGGAGTNGRRILYVSTDPSGSLFITGQSILSPTGWDIIRFKFSLSDTVPWIEAIAHETAHAFARVTAQGAGPTTAVQRVQASVLDECKTRRVEQQVLKEIRATQKGSVALAGHTPRAVRTCDCERDWFPIAQKRTYLEEFVLGADWETAASGLSTADRDKIKADVAAIPLKWSTKPQPPTMLVSILRGTAPVASFAGKFPVLKSAAGQAAFVLRIVDLSWRQLISKVVEDSPTWKGGAHQLRLERHVRLFFKIPVTYTACSP